MLLSLWLYVMPPISASPLSPKPSLEVSDPEVEINCKLASPSLVCPFILTVPSEVSSILVATALEPPT